MLVSLARLHARLQHSRQQQEPDRRSLCRVQAGLRRRWRRRQFHPHDRRRAQLLRTVFRRRRRAASAGRPYHRLGRQRPAHAGSLPDGSEPGSRLRSVRHRPARSDVGHVNGVGTRWAAPCTGAPASRRRRRSTFLPKDAGLKGAVFADAGSLWDYKGPTSWNVTGETLRCRPTPTAIRASVGVGLIWNSPFGPLRFDYSFPLMKQGYDRVQAFRFGGGTKF